MKCVGIYPGSFDPVHEGHLAFARAALSAGELDEVVFLPEMKPRGKPQISPLAVRIRALKAKTAQYQRLQVMSLPIERFTVADTLAVLQSKFKDARLVLLVGSDIVDTFQYRWPGIDTLLHSVDLIIGLRDSHTAQDIAKLVADLEAELKFQIDYSIIITPYAHLASSKIRTDEALYDGAITM